MEGEERNRNSARAKTKGGGKDRTQTHIPMQNRFRRARSPRSPAATSQGNFPAAGMADCSNRDRAERVRGGANIDRPVLTQPRPRIRLSIEPLSPRATGRSPHWRPS